METNYTFNQSTYIALQKRRIIFYSILAFIGLIGIITFIILYQISHYNKYYVFIFIPSLILFVSGILYIVMIIVMIHKLKEIEVQFEYQFKEEFVKIKTYSKGEMTSESDLYYKFIYRYRDTGEILFLYLANKKVFPLSSHDPQIDKIKEIISLKDIPKKKI